MPRISIGFIVILTFLFSLSLTKFPLQIPRTLWVFWDNNIDSAPMLVQLCVAKMKAVCEKENWTLQILNQKNLHQYIPNYETQFMQIRRHAAHPDWKAALSDLVRLHVLAANGGVYMDITTILFEGLGWLDRLDQVPYLLTNSDIHNRIQPDCIIPHIAFYQNSGESRDSEGRITNWLPGYEAWFIASKKNATFIQKWRKNHLKHYQLSAQQNGKDEINRGYFLRHHLGGDYLIVDKSASEVIQQEQARLDKKLTLLGNRKNINREFKILGLHGQFGPFALYLGYAPRQEDFVSLTIQQMEQKYYAPVHFFVKLTNTYRNFFDGVFHELKKISARFGTGDGVFEKFMSARPSYQDCVTVKFIVKGSPFGGLLEDNIKAQQQQIFTITTQQRDIFYAFCKQTYRVELKQPVFYDNLYYYISRLIEVSELINLSHERVVQIKTKFDQFLKEKFRFAIVAPRNWMGWVIQPAETIYWEKRHQKMTLQEGDVSNLGNYHGVKQAYEHQYSDFELRLLKIRMYIFVHRVQILTCVLHWIGFMFVFSILGLVYLAFTTAFWAFQKVYKYNVRPFVWAYMAIRQPQIIVPVKQYLLKLVTQQKESFRSVNRQKSIRWIGKALKFILLKIFALLLGAAFFAYNTFILYYYDMVLHNGKIYEQQWVFLTIVLLQIAFRIAGSWLGDNVMVLPGIQFKFLYYLFLPVYYYFFGAELLSLVRPFENQNFSIAFYLALCMPIIIKLIQHQSRYGVKKIIIKPEDQQNTPKIFARNLHFVLSDLTGWIEKLVIAFLVGVIITNLRFLRNSEGYILVKFFDLLSQSKLPWLILVGLYIIKAFLQIIDVYWSGYKNLRQSFDLARAQQNNYISSKKSIDYQKISDNLRLFTEQINQRIQWIKTLSIHAFKSLVIIAKYYLRAYAIYVLLFSDQIEYMISHVFQINFDHTFMKMTFMNVHFAFVFISFIVEIYIENQFWECFEKTKFPTKKIDFGMEDSLNEQTKGNQKFSNQDAQEVFGLKKNVSDLKNYEVFLSLWQILFFILPRLFTILKFYEFFNLNSREIKFQKKDFQYNILLMIAPTLASYLILVPLIRINIRSADGRDSYSGELLPSEDRQIEPKDQETNNY